MGECWKSPAILGCKTTMMLQPLSFLKGLSGHNTSSAWSPNNSWGTGQDAGNPAHTPSNQKSVPKPKQATMRHHAPENTMLGPCQAGRHAATHAYVTPEPKQAP